ncbi:MAG: iron-containing redox enzyme family protein [Candidatus Kaiserbacteria bacterium]|nr:iron-containing redox enzyme family protein [Candidatus Kaiserbacteria bacterium]
MSSDLLRRVNDSLDRSRANAAHHPFFAHFLQKKTPEQVRRFAQQWYLAAKNHKVAFPHLVAITQDDETRRELIEILRDEYGNGDPDEVHARLLQKFLEEGIGMPLPSSGDAVPEIAAFGDKTLTMWRDADPVTAFGYHYALERIAQDIHKVFLHGLENGGFPLEVLKYFVYHSTAEEEHVRITKKGFDRYAADPSNREALLNGVTAGEQALAGMWDGFERHIFH